MLSIQRRWNCCFWHILDYKKSRLCVRKRKIRHGNMGKVRLNMYTSEYIKEELYTKYILPTDRKKENYIGIEVEIPIVALDGSATSYTVAQNCMEAAIEKFHLKPERWDENGICYSAVHEQTGDIFSPNAYCGISADRLYRGRIL